MEILSEKTVNGKCILECEFTDEEVQLLVNKAFNDILRDAMENKDPVKIEAPQGRTVSSPCGI